MEITPDLLFTELLKFYAKYQVENRAGSWVNKILMSLDLSQ